MPPKRAATKEAKPKAAPKKKGSKKGIVQLSAEGFMAAVNKEFGPGTMKMASDPSLRITRIPTGILSLDYLLGGGFPRNRYVEIYGSAHVGKTYIALTYIATAQALGLRCCWVECENTWDPVFAEACGVDLAKLGFHEQRHANQVVDFMETLLYSRMWDVIVLDSIASLLPEPELNTSMSAGSMGMEQAKMLSKAFRKLTTALKGGTSMILLNQQRDAIGVTYGKKTTEPGGRAIKHYTGIRLEVVRTENLTKPGKSIDIKNNKQKDSKLVVGHRILLRVQKDKTGGAKPYDESTMVFSYTKGRHEHLEDLIYLGRVYDLIGVNTTDKWWAMGYEDEMVHGRPAFKKWLRKNRAVREELEEKIIARIVESEPSDDD